MCGGLVRRELVEPYKIRLYFCDFASLGGERKRLLLSHEASYTLYLAANWGCFGHVFIDFIRDWSCMVDRDHEDEARWMANKDMCLEQDIVHWRAYMAGASRPRAGERGYTDNSSSRFRGSTGHCCL